MLEAQHAAHTMDELEEAVDNGFIEDEVKFNAGENIYVGRFSNGPGRKVRHLRKPVKLANPVELSLGFGLTLRLRIYLYMHVCID